MMSCTQWCRCGVDLNPGPHTIIAAGQSTAPGAVQISMPGCWFALRPRATPASSFKPALRKTVTFDTRMNVVRTPMSRDQFTLGMMTLIEAVQP